MNFLWAFECTKDTSGTGGIDIDSYAKVCKAQEFRKPTRSMLISQDLSWLPGRSLAKSKFEMNGEQQSLGNRLPENSPPPKQQLWFLHKKVDCNH